MGTCLDSLIAMVEPEAIDVSENRTEWYYNELIARRERDTFVFLDSVFLSEGAQTIGGAKGSRMVPVTEEEMDRRRENYKDPEHSPMRHVYDDISPTESWETWIGEQLRVEGDRLLYDPSYEHKFGDAVREACADDDDLPDPDDIVAVECIGGGRMFAEVENSYDVVYSQEHLAIARDAEEGSFPDV